MPEQVVIVGAGMGGLTAAIRLARFGCHVTVLEARGEAGGLASGLTIEGFPFDAGPYVLLDRPGLEWAFRQLELDLTDHLDLKRIEQVYQVNAGDDHPIQIDSDLQRTATALDSRWPGSGRLYQSFIRRTAQTYARLQPLQWVSRPRASDILKSGAWRDIPFLLRNLKSIMANSRLPAPVTRALSIWTHVAGQTIEAAPAPLALVPSVIHQIGAFYPQGGIAAVPRVLFEQARSLGVQFCFDTRARQIRMSDGVAGGVETADGEFHQAQAVISDVGLATYLSLLADDDLGRLPAAQRRRLQDLPLQSPGICAYLAVRGTIDPPYLRFRLYDEPDGCRLLITPGTLDSTLQQDGWWPARLIAPMNHQRAAAGESQQRAFLQSVLEDPWWRDQLDEVRVLATRIPNEWGAAFHLFRQSMNPVMTAQLMRSGRLAHRSPWFEHLYLTGSATHPGQWVSFAAVSGVLAANQLIRDIGGTQR